MARSAQAHYESLVLAKVDGHPKAAQPFTMKPGFARTNDIDNVSVTTPDL